MDELYAMDRGTRIAATASEASKSCKAERSAAKQLATDRNDIVLFDFVVAAQWRSGKSRAYH